MTSPVTAKAAESVAAPKARKRARAIPAGGKKLVIVESPAKAKTINKYLGPTFVVRASMGHVRDLPAKGLGVDVEHDFKPEYEPLGTRRKVLAELKKYAKVAPEIFLATDLDREGEAIAWHLAEALDIAPERMRRVVFNEITKPAIQAAFANPGQIDLHKVDAQQARRVLDRVVGYQVSPLLWRKIAMGLSAGRVQTVAVRLVVERERAIQSFMPEEFWKVSAVFRRADSAGLPIDQLERSWRGFLAATNETGQGPTQAQQLEFLSEQEAFRAELVEWRGERPALTAADATLEIAKALGLEVERIDRQDDPKAKGPAQHKVTLYGHLARPGPAWKIESVQARPSQVRPPAPFTTASLQQAASVQLRFSASRTMRLAQQLYEGIDLPGEGSVGLITYMRTDSMNLSPQAVGQAREFIGQRFGAPYVPEKPNFFRSGPRAQAAHEAVRPTEASRAPESLRGALEGDLLKLYELIWRRFIACQMTPAVWEVTEAAIGADSPAGRGVFKAAGRRLVFDGFLAVAGRARSEEQQLPQLTVGQPAQAVDLSPTQHFTQPPPRYTEASLVKALEAEGIGRPSTYAAIIQTIQDRTYVRQEDRKFFATELGIKVVDKLVKAFPDLFDVGFTARMEDQLDEIESGKIEWVSVVREFYGPFKDAVERASAEMVHAKAESDPSEYVCPNCQKPMAYRWSKNGRYLACTGYPECKTTFPVDENGQKVERKEVDAPCPNCGKKMMLRRSRFGVFLGCTGYPECKGIVPCDKDGNPLKVVKEEDLKEMCPECGSPMAVRRKGRRPFLGCTRYPECKGLKPIPEGIRLESPPRPPPEPAGMDCPKCGKTMVIREGPRGKFVACTGFPRCRNAFDISKLDEMKANAAANPAPAKPAKAKGKAKSPRAAKK